MVPRAPGSPRCRRENRGRAEPTGRRAPHRAGADDLVIEDLVVGDGPEATPGSLVSAHYVGVTHDGGEQFDASWDRGDPLEFRLGVGMVIQGWDEGITGMKVGGRRRLTIPAHKAYGERGAGGVIKPGATLVFVVDLVGVRDIPVGTLSRGRDSQAYRSARLGHRDVHDASRHDAASDADTTRSVDAAGDPDAKANSSANGGAPAEAQDSGGESTGTVIVAGVANLAIAIAKLIGGLISHSSAMLSEAAHSVADTVTEVFLFVALKRGEKPPDEKHPFGYGRETYFWAFIASMATFLVGAGFSIYQGISTIIERKPEGSPTISYIVLAVSFVLEGTSFLKAVRQVRGAARTWACGRPPT